MLKLACQRLIGWLQTSLVKLTKMFEFWISLILRMLTCQILAMRNIGLSNIDNAKYWHLHMRMRSCICVWWCILVVNRRILHDARCYVMSSKHTRMSNSRAKQRLHSNASVPSIAFLNFPFVWSFMSFFYFLFISMNLLFRMFRKFEKYSSN